MTKYLFMLLILAISANVFAQSKPATKKTTSAYAPKMLLDGKDVDKLIFRLVDPKDIQGVQLEGISASDMANPANSKPKAINSTLKPSAKTLNLQEFFTYYKIPEVNQNIIKVNGVLLKKRENFMASKAMIEKVNLDKDNINGPCINIITVKAKK